MKKNFKSYALIWAIFLVAFNVIVFLVRPIIPGYEIHYDLRFWIAWLFVMAAFVGNLLCANKAFQAENLEKLFYKVPLISVSYRGLIGMLVLGGALMRVPGYFCLGGALRGYILSITSIGTPRIRCSCLFVAE